MTANENLCVGPLLGSLRLQLSISGRKKPCRFLQLDGISVLFMLWFSRLGIPAEGLDPTLLRRIQPDAYISLWLFSCCLCVPSQPSCVSAALPTSHIVLKLILLSACGYVFSLAIVQLLVPGDFSTIYL